MLRSIFLCGCLAATQIAVASDPATIARRILDDALPAQERQQLAAGSAGEAAGVVAAIVADLPADDAIEEYRRIPWIWRVSVAAGRRNADAPLQALLGVSLPRKGEKLRDWQAVVIGGGIVNGISLEGAWPRERIDALIGRDELLRQRWQQAMAASAAMADDAQIKPGTRYDALRMIALDPTDERIAQLAKYLAAGTNAELQMGAVSGLSDVRDERGMRLLAEGLPGLAQENRALAVDALLRTDERIDLLLGLLAADKLMLADLSQPQQKKLRELPAGPLRERALRLLAD